MQHLLTNVQRSVLTCWQWEMNMLPRVRVCEIADAPEILNLSLGSLLPLETSATIFYICIKAWAQSMSTHEHAIVKGLLYETLNQSYLHDIKMLLSPQYRETIRNTVIALINKMQCFNLCTSARTEVSINVYIFLFIVHHCLILSSHMLFHFITTTRSVYFLADASLPSPPTPFSLSTTPFSQFPWPKPMKRCISSSQNLRNLEFENGIMPRD